MPESVSRFCDFLMQSASHLTTGELIVRTALVCCSLFATVQLLSMMATHYGDNNATSKSFFLSLLLHCCFGLGWATVVDMTPRSFVASDEPDPKRVRIRLTQEGPVSEEPGARSGKDVDRTSQPFEMEISRHSPKDQDLTPDEMPSLEASPSLQVPQPASPDLPSRMDSPTPLPAQQSAPSVAVSPAQPSAAIDQPLLKSRPENQVTPTVSRQQMARQSSNMDLSTNVELQRGAAERTAPVMEDGAVLTLPNEVTAEVAIPKAVGLPEETIRRRSNPNPITDEIAISGDSPSARSPKTTGDSRSSKFARTGSRNGPDTNLETTPPTQPVPAPTAALPLLEPTMSSRPSPASELPGKTPRPELARIESSPATGSAPTRDPETYRSRRTDQRKAAAVQNGGSKESERAVELSLKWMSGVQEPAGHWSAAKHGGGAAKKDPQGQNRLDGGLHADSGVTGLIVLAYLGAGYTHEQGKYADVVAKALKWLIAQQHSNGYLGGDATRYDMMYCHAMAAFALAEAYGMQADPDSYPELRDAVVSATRLICAMQNEDGGWRYGKGGESDMSMFGWQLMALKSAVKAGIPIPEDTSRGMTKFLQGRALGQRGGLAGYKVNDPPSPAMTAEALFCRQMFIVRPRDGASQEAVGYLRQNLPRMNAYDEYYWYYGTLAMYQYGGEPWNEWNGALRDRLIGLQRSEGPLAGSWDPNGKWAGIGGRLYSTALSTMCLEVYYRYLRIYQSNDEMTSSRPRSDR